MNKPPISIQKLKTAKTWEQLRTRLDEVLEVGAGNKHVDVIIQPILRQKPPADFKEYKLLNGDLGQVMYGDREFGNIGEVVHQACSTTNIPWMTALLKHYPMDKSLKQCGQAIQEFVHA